jgi:hypothetical protein
MPYPPVRLGGRSLTKKELERWTQRVLSSEGGLDDPRDQRIACEAVATYDKVLETGCGVARVRVAPHPEWGSLGHLCMHVHLDGGGELTVSRKNVVRSCFVPRETVRARRGRDAELQTMRAAVEDQVKAFKDASRGPAGWTCALCSTSGARRTNFHVDHVNEFRFLVAEFEEEASPGRALTPAKAPEGWAAWHEERATLRVLCKGCNLRRLRPAA